MVNHIVCVKICYASNPITTHAANNKDEIANNPITNDFLVYHIILLCHCCFCPTSIILQIWSIQLFWFFFFSFDATRPIFPPPDFSCKSSSVLAKSVSVFGSWWRLTPSHAVHYSSYLRVPLFSQKKHLNLLHKNELSMTDIQEITADIYGETNRLEAAWIDGRCGEGHPKPPSTEVMVHESFSAKLSNKDIRKQKNIYMQSHIFTNNHENTEKMQIQPFSSDNENGGRPGDRHRCEG